jgi:hypothetical protein
MIFNMTPNLLKGLGTYPFHIAIPDQRVNNIHFKTFLTDSLVRTDEVMELDYYQPDCNLFLSVRIALEYLLLLIGHELWIEKNHSERVHNEKEVSLISPCSLKLEGLVYGDFSFARPNAEKPTFL